MAGKIELADLPTMEREVRERAFNYRTRNGGRRRNHTSSLVGGGGGGGTTPDTILGVIMTQWVRGDFGVTESGGAVSAWADQSGNGHNFAQSTGGSKPTYTAVDATLNNQPTVTGDNVGDDILSNSTMPNGGTMWVYGVIKLITHTAPRMIWGSKQGDAVEAGEFYCATSPNVALYNGGSLNMNPNGGLPAGTWGRVEMFFSTSGSYLKCRGTLVNTNSNVGSNSNTGCAIFGSQGGAALGANVAIAERIVCSSLPSAGQITALDAYVTGRYGAGLV